MRVTRQRTHEARLARRRGGFSYIEVMLATALVGLLLAPAFDALLVGLESAGVHEELTQQHYRAQARLVDLDTESFGALDAAAQAVASSTVPTAYSDAPGTPMRRLVFLSRYDPDSDPPAPDPAAAYGLLWLRVAIEGSAYGLETLRAQ